MNYLDELKAVQKLIVEGNNAFGFDHFGLDNTTAKMDVTNAAYMHIVNGDVFQKSVGAPLANKHVTSGVLYIIALFDTNIQAKAKADLITTAFMNLKIDEAASQPTNQSAFVIDFSSNGRKPSAAFTTETPFVRLTVTIPFTRTQRA